MPENNKVSIILNLTFEIEEFERKYDCNYAEFITKVSNEGCLKAIENRSPNWEEDMIGGEYWEKEFEECKMRLVVPS